MKCKRWNNSWTFHTVSPLSKRLTLTSSTKMFQRRGEAFFIPEKPCVFLAEFWQLSYSSPSPTHTVTLCWFTKKSCLIFQSWNYAALILNTVCSFFFFFVFCHVIEDKCWQCSFKQSMRLKCTARTECIKYINKSIYLKSFVPKWCEHHVGNNEVTRARWL